MKQPPESIPKSITEEFILGSDSMHSILKVVQDVAKFDVSILLCGESGTGKEMLAKIIHLQSPRAANPFVPVNCGILSGMMFEDKLFGHEKGAFTGAISRKCGCFELAHKGTLFLDEVSEIPLDNQVDFLRVLEDFRFMRIGGHELIQKDIRLISATNKDLRKEVAQGNFREDLFFRLQVVPIFIPALRERRRSIPKIVNHFLDRFVTVYKKPKPSIHPDVMDLFQRYDWPGNVRELKNLLERVFIVSNAEAITKDHLPSDFLWHFTTPVQTMNLDEIRADAEKKAILEVLYRTGGDREKSAQILGISARTLRHKLQTQQITVDRRGNLVPKQ